MAASARKADDSRVITDGQVAALGRKNAAALQRVSRVAQRLSGLAEDEVDELTVALGNDPSRFWFRRPLALGHWSVAACQCAVSSRGFTEWLAYSRLEPFGADGNDHRFAQLMALTANVNQAPKRRKTPWTPADLLPRRGPRPALDQGGLRPRIDAAMAAAVRGTRPR